MQNAIYRGLQYVVAGTPAPAKDVNLTYRGVEYNPSDQEQFATPEASLTYRGTEYKRPGCALERIRNTASKRSRLAAARVAFTRNCGSATVV